MPCDGGASVAAGAVVLHPSVAEALASGGAVVALESTIVSHGMPYPQNLQMAREVEAIVRARGATPATVAIIDGVPRVGLDDADLRRLAELGARARKVSRRDVPAVIARRETGATTVSATALLAARAGVSVFVTGGVGGVHRGGETSMDVSADLTELAKTPRRRLLRRRQERAGHPAHAGVPGDAGRARRRLRRQRVPRVLLQKQRPRRARRRRFAGASRARDQSRQDAGLGGLYLRRAHP
jgi:hypothetical protein